MRTLCQTLKVSKSGFYAWRDRLPCPRQQVNIALVARIKEAHAMSDATYGMPRIRAELLDWGIVASRKRIARLMRLAHIQGVSHRREFCVTTRRDKSQRAAPDLVKRQFVATDVNQLWVAFGKRCEEMGVRPSMGTVGDAYDNAMAESFFATLECELIDRRSWQTHAQARTAIFTWIEGWYNPRRRHSSLGQISPINFERKHQTPQIKIPRPETGLPTVCFAPVDKTPQGLIEGPSPCPQASTVDNPASSIMSQVAPTMPT